MYDQQVNLLVFDDVENKVQQLVDDEHQASNDDDVQQQPLRHKLLHMDHRMMY